MLAESLQAARLRAAHGEPPRARPLYAPLLARLGAALVAVGAALHARYSQEGGAMARSLH
jgi:hypothetical protein